jgi:hypothetical protein
MSTICLGMLLGSHTLKWPVGGYLKPPSTIIVVGKKQQLPVDGHTGQSGTPDMHCSLSGALSRQPTIGVCSRRPLDPTITQIVQCTPDSPVLQPEGALRAPLRRLPSVPPDSPMYTGQVTVHCPVCHQCAG